MHRKETRILGSLLVFLGLFTLFHHLLISGRFFDWKDILHHEFLEAILFTAGLILILVSRPAKE
jgi:hypothetical protein